MLSQEWIERALKYHAKNLERKRQEELNDAIANVMLAVIAIALVVLICF